MPSRILVAYYTRTGTTQQLARWIAAAVDADLERVVDLRKRTGALGFVRSLWEAGMQRIVPIEPPVRDPTQYDLVVIGTPIWADSVASPVRSYLEAHRNELRTVAFFCACRNSNGDRRVFGQMAELCGVRPVATLTVRESMIEDCARAVERFAVQLTTRVAAPPPFVVGPPAASPR
jgi:flavodoxin